MAFKTLAPPAFSHNRGSKPKAAEYGLYVMWSEGWGTPKNVKIVSKHLQNSAELGFPRAMYALGLSYRAKTYGVKEDLEKPYYWLRKDSKHRLLEYNE